MNTHVDWHRAERRRYIAIVVTSVALTATLAVIATAAPLEGVACCATSDGAQVRPQDQVVLVSSRYIACMPCLGCDPAELQYATYVPGEGWMQTDPASLLSGGGSQVATVFYVHGHRVDPDRAVRVGWQAYHALTAGADERPVRFVIWSWPSAQTGRGMQDVREKAARTDLEGYLLAALVSRFDADAQIGLVGWSFGARIATGALHVLGGGQLCGQALPAANVDQTRSLRVALWGAAMHDGWLAVGAYHGQALGQVDRMLLLNNGCDPILRRYRLVSRCDRPEALGYRGVACMEQLGAAAGRIDQIDVCCIVGREHSSGPYLCSPLLTTLTRQYVLWEPVD